MTLHFHTYSTSNPSHPDLILVLLRGKPFTSVVSGWNTTYSQQRGVCVCFIQENMICDHGVAAHCKLGYYRVTLGEVTNAQFSLLGCLRSCVPSHACACKCVWDNVPNFTIYPKLIGVCEHERNASCLDRQSMALIFQLYADVFRNQSKRQGHWVRTMTFIDRAGYNIL